MVSTKNGGHHCGYSKLRSAVGAGRTLTVFARAIIVQKGWFIISVVHCGLYLVVRRFRDVNVPAANILARICTF